MARVLVVGGAGYVGGAVTDLLAPGPHEVRVYDSLLYEEGYRKPVDFVLGDVRDRTRLAPHLAWADVVVWLAAIVGDGACALDPDLAVELNDQAVRHLADRFDGRILFTSTCSVYGAQDDLLDEASPVNPLSVYAQTKHTAEGHLIGKNAIIFRLGTLFGVSDHYSRIRMDLAVNVLTAKAYLYKRISVFGGEQYRPLLHVRDVARAVVANLETRHEGIFNLHAENVRIGDLADRIKAHFPETEIQRTEMKFQDSRNYRVSSDKARATFGFAPKYSVDDGIAELKAILEAGRIKNISQPRHWNQRFLREVTARTSSPLGFEVRPGG
jgi:nucleoside-diphosphate-sugar epimerase